MQYKKYIPLPLPAAGPHGATLSWVADLGLQKNNYEGTESIRPEVLLGYELDLLMDDGRPFMISKRYNLSTWETSALMGLIGSWVGNNPPLTQDGDIDLFALIGKTALVNVVYTLRQDKTEKASIGSVTPLPDAMGCSAPINAPIRFDLDAYDESAFNRLPNWVQKVISERETSNAA